MKKIVYACVIGLSLSSLMSCKKDKDSDPAVNIPVNSDAKADDTNARSELDKAYDDIEKAYNSQDYDNSSSSRTAAVALPCGNVSFDKKNFTIQYGGVNCGSRVLSGSIEVTLIAGTKFSDQDAKLKVVFKDYKVYYNASKESIVYNGTAYITNTTGGTLINLYTSTPNVIVSHKVRGSLELTFDSTGTGSNNVIRNWNLFRKKTYENIPGTAAGITLKVEGDTTFDADSYIPGMYENVSEYGIGREGNKFVAVLSTPFKWENCGSDYYGPYILKQGEVDYTADLSSNPSLVLLGITKGTWSATAGYKFVQLGQYAPDGTCSSNAYKLYVAYKKADGTIVYSNTSYQLY